MYQTLSQGIENEELAQRKYQSGSRLHSACTIRQSRQLLNWQSERLRKLTLRESSVHTIGCYDMQGWHVMHSWTTYSHPRSLDHQQGTTPHKNCFANDFGHVFVVLTEGKNGINISKVINKYFK